MQTNINRFLWLVFKLLIFTFHSTGIVGMAWLSECWTHHTNASIPPNTKASWAMQYWQWTTTPSWTASNIFIQKEDTSVNAASRTGCQWLTYGNRILIQIIMIIWLCNCGSFWWSPTSHVVMLGWKSPQGHCPQFPFHSQISMHVNGPHTQWWTQPWLPLCNHCYCCSNQMHYDGMETTCHHGGLVMMTKTPSHVRACSLMGERSNSLGTARSSLIFINQ